ncbi:hypothetical protein HDV02_001434 [Globomyces sp. JEL0801]|nr:hypothetical protein HDV02_001434 [Globomyces sp. JEL0801]
MKLSTILIYVYPILSAPTSSYDPFSLFAQYSTATYCPSVFDSETLKCGKGVCTGIVEQTQIVAVGKNNQTDGFSLVGYHEELKMIVVMFRGSKTLKNLELNLELDQSVVHWLPQPSSNKAYPANLKVHQGMKKVYESIRDQIQPKVLDLAMLHADWPIFFVGHSLGGALATLAATDFAFTNDLSDRVHLYTYGAPRLGNLAWAMFVDGLKFAGSRRIIQRGDPG